MYFYCQYLRHFAIKCVHNINNICHFKKVIDCFFPKGQNKHQVKSSLKTILGILTINHIGYCIQILANLSLG